MSAPTAEAPFRGRAFGLDLAADFELPGVLTSDRTPTSVTDRALRLTLGPPAAEWPSADVQRTFELPGEDGRPVLTIDRHAAAGYRVEIPALGVCVVAADGRELAYAPADDGPNRWRLLLGQGLPIAAALQGLEVLHASAAVLDGRGLAFVAASGTGKTSLALALREHGAGFLADDVVALEAGEGRLLVHPGLGIAHVPGQASKHHMAVRVHPEPSPLHTLYFLERSRDMKVTEIVPLDPPDPRLLLASTFVAHVPTAERLITQLDICAHIARSVRVYWVRSPLDGGPAALAARVAEHARSTG